MTSSTRIDEYVIEVDDGINGEFQEVHRTPDPFCTLALVYSSILFIELAYARSMQRVKVHRVI